MEVVQVVVGSPRNILDLRNFETLTRVLNAYHFYVDIFSTTRDPAPSVLSHEVHILTNHLDGKCTRLHLDRKQGRSKGLRQVLSFISLVHGVYLSELRHGRRVADIDVADQSNCRPGSVYIAWRIEQRSRRRGYILCQGNNTLRRRFR